MKKSVIATIGGLVLGVLIIVGAFAILQTKSSTVNANNHNNSAGSTEQSADSTENSVDGTENDAGTEIKPDMEVDGMIAGGDSVFQETENVMAETENTSESTVSEENSQEESKKVDYPYYIRVNRQANCVTIYTKDKDGNYSVPVKAMACSVGLTGNTPLGISKITDKYVWRFLFGNVYGQYSVRFNGHILFHSVPYLERSKDTLKEGQYNLLGEPASQGCIRLSCADAKWIYDNCRKGTKVEVYDSPDPGPLGKPATAKISPDSPYKGWDPTDPDPANPWKKGKVAISGVQSLITINQGDKLDLLNGVFATDIDGLPLAVEVTGDVDTNVPGHYTVTYLATSVLGTQEKITTNVVVNAVEPPVSEKPGTEMPDTEEPDTEIPGTEMPGTEEPDTEIPGTEMPGTEEPDTEIPGTEMPGTEMPGTEEPDMEAPGTEVSDTETLGTEMPEIEEPDMEAPGTEVSDTETLGTEMPEIEEPYMETLGTEEPDTEIPRID